MRCTALQGEHRRPAYAYVLERRVVRAGNIAVVVAIEPDFRAGTRIFQSEPLHECLSPIARRDAAFFIAQIFSGIDNSPRSKQPAPTAIAGLDPIEPNPAALVSGEAAIHGDGDCLNQSVMTPPKDQYGGQTRRALLEGSTAMTLLLASPTIALCPKCRRRPSAPVDPSDIMPVTLKVNRQDRVLKLDPRTTLLDALRHQLGLTGSKKGCDHGQCGACTVLVNGRRINACPHARRDAPGRRDHHDRGAGRRARLCTRCKRPFIAHDGLQCGYCTPGQICSAAGMLNEAEAGWPSHVTADLATVPALSDAEIRERDERQYLPLRRLSQHRRRHSPMFARRA